jgi:hypothetical protein
MARIFNKLILTGLLGFLAVTSVSQTKGYAVPLTGNFSVSLSSLDGSNTVLQVGDKLFSGFEVDCTNVDCDNVFVRNRTSTINGVEEYGLRFVILGSSATATEGVLRDIALEFNVTTTFGDNRIIDDFLALNGAAEGGAFISISESVEDENKNAVAGAQLLVFDDPNGERFTDTGIFAPQNILHIIKDVSWSCDAGTGPDCRAFLSDFSQLFSQLQVPEPASMLLFGLGLAGLGFWGRKRLGK